MKVAVLIHEDHHCDVEVTVFLDTQQAIYTAKQRARKADLHGSLNEELGPSMKRAGWLYYGQYGAEGDYIRVEEKEVYDQS